MQGLESSPVGVWVQRAISEIRGYCREKSGLEGVLHLSYSGGGCDYLVGRV